MSTPNVPPVVSKRNHFTAAEEFVDDALSSLPRQCQHDDFRIWFRDWLLRYTVLVIRHMAMHFATGAERGIEQTAALLCDPEFYATRRSRRDRQREQMRDQQAKQEWERLEREVAPTREQIDQQIKWSEREVTYHRAQLVAHERKIETLKAKRAGLTATPWERLGDAPEATQ